LKKEEKEAKKEAKQLAKEDKEQAIVDANRMKAEDKLKAHEAKLEGET